MSAYIWTLHAQTQTLSSTSQSRAFLHIVRLHLRCIVPSGELYCEIMHYSASLTPCSLHTDAACHGADSAWTHTYTCSYVIRISSQQADARIRAHAHTHSWCTWQTVKRMWDHIARAIINTHVSWAKELLVIKSKVTWMKSSSASPQFVSGCCLKSDYRCCKLIQRCKKIWDVEKL